MAINRSILFKQLLNLYIRSWLISKVKSMQLENGSGKPNKLLLTISFTMAKNI